jgi:hypothetical protein
VSATFDATTTAAYEAATTAQSRAEAIVASLTGTISVTVYNGSNAAMGTGTMAAPWASASAGVVTLGEVSSFTVGTTATPDANWYIRFENSDASRWVRGSFGLADSGQDYTWSLATWTATQTGTIGTATIIAAGNSAPVFTVAPTSASIASTGGTIQFAATDPEGGSVFYSLMTTRAGITINASTGLVTVTAAAAGTSGNIVVRASDGILFAEAASSVTVGAGSEVKFTPGHYMTVYDWTGGGDTQAGRFAMYDAIAGESCIKGVNLMLRWGWRLMEPSYGVYNLDWLQTELDYLHARGKKMLFWPFFGRWSTYSDAWRTTATPDYALNGTYGYGIASVNGGIGGVYREWEPIVRARLDALCIAIGQRFDSHPAFEGFRPFCESSFSVVGLPVGSHEPALRTAIANTLTTIKPYFPTTVCYGALSWLNNIGQLFPTLAALGCGAGGTDQYPWPDGYPGNPGAAQKTDSDDVYFGRGDDWGNQLGTSYLGVIPYWNDNQDPVYGSKEGYWIPAEIYVEGVKKRQTHMTWVRMYDPIANTSYGEAAFDRTDMTWTQYRAAVIWSSGILPFLRANPTTWATRPSSIG